MQKIPAAQSCNALTRAECQILPFGMSSEWNKSIPSINLGSQLRMAVAMPRLRVPDQETKILNESLSTILIRAYPMMPARRDRPELGNENDFRPLSS